MMYTALTLALWSLAAQKGDKNVIFDREYYSIRRYKYLHDVHHQKEVKEICTKMYLLLEVPIRYIEDSFILIRLILKNLIVHHSWQTNIF